MEPLGYVMFTLPIMTHPGVYTLPSNLQLCYKPLGILQRVTESQKVHITSHDGLQNFITSILLNIDPRASQCGKRVVGICLSITNTKFVK